MVRDLRIALLLALVTTITAPVVFFARPVSADQISALQARATQISQSILQEQLQIGADEQQYSVSTQKVVQDDRLIAQTQRGIALDRHRLGLDRQNLQREAVTTYVDFGSVASEAAPLFQSQSTWLRENEYQDVAIGDVSDTMDQLHTAQNVLVAAESSLHSQQVADQAVQSQAASLLNQAQNTGVELQSEETQVKGELATAIAQQQAAEEAQAAAEQAAAAVARAANPAAPSGPSQAAGATVLPTLNSFLTCVVQAESSGNYGAVSPNGQYMGAFQFSQSTWNEAALLAGLPSLVGVAPNTASPADQDALAIALYDADGRQPWYDPCR